jgi:hypothetical protein
LIGAQFDFQFPALQTPAAFKSFEIALADFPQAHLRAGDIDCQVTLDDILVRVFFDIFRDMPHFKNSLDFVAAFMLGHGVFLARLQSHTKRDFGVVDENVTAPM